MEGTPPMSLSEDETGVKLIIIIIIIIINSAAVPLLEKKMFQTLLSVALQQISL